MLAGTGWVAQQLPTVSDPVIAPERSGVVCSGHQWWVEVRVATLAGYIRGSGSDRGFRVQKLGRRDLRKACRCACGGDQGLHQTYAFVLNRRLGPAGIRIAPAFGSNGGDHEFDRNTI